MAAGLPAPPQHCAFILLKIGAGSASAVPPAPAAKTGMDSFVCCVLHLQKCTPPAHE